MHLMAATFKMYFDLTMNKQIELFLSVFCNGTIQFEIKIIENNF